MAPHMLPAWRVWIVIEPSKQPLNMKHPVRSTTARILSIPAAAIGLSLAPLLLSGSAAFGQPVVAANQAAGAYVGSEVWYAAMRKSPDNQSMLQSLAHTNVVESLPADCIEVAGTITFPEGNPFPEQRIPPLDIYCRDQGADSFGRSPRVDASGNFYTVFKKGQVYDFYWRIDKTRQRFCTLQLRPDAKPRQKMTIPYHPPKTQPEEPKVETRRTSALVAEYDLSGFPAHPVSPEAKRIAEAIETATGTLARAEAHEMLSRYYQEKWETARAKAEAKKAQKLREDVNNP
jgi:hypothetical protein